MIPLWVQLQMHMDHPKLDPETPAADAVSAVEEFCKGVRHSAN